MTTPAHRYSPEQIARVAHEANRALQAIQADPHPSAPWGRTSDHTRQIAVSGVEFARSGMTARELHEHWLTEKRAAGWRYGPVKNPGARTHPCMLPWDFLPADQRDKDVLFCSVVMALDEPNSRPRP